MAFRAELICYVCNKRFTSSRQLSRVSAGDRAEEVLGIARNRRRSLGNAREPEGNIRICFNCKVSINEELRILDENLLQVCLKLNVVVTSGNHSSVICGSEEDTHRVTMKNRAFVFLESNIFMPADTRTCPHHLDESTCFVHLFLTGLQSINRPIIVDGDEFNSFLQGVRVAKQPLGFIDIESLSDNDFQILIGLSKDQFADMFSFCDRVPIIVNEEVTGYRYVSKKDRFMFLTKLRQGLSDDLLKVMYGYSSRQNTSSVVALVRESLELRFVSQNVGLDAITRDDFINNQVTPFSNQLFNPEPDIPRVILIIDGTYSYIQKCRNFRVLRQYFNVHKSRHLLKPVMVVPPDDYILDVQGPYFSDARNNDAHLLRNEFDRDADRIRSYLQEDDILIVDRGYRDAVELLDRLGVAHKMPALLARSQAQLTTEEANETRLITKIRWVVEARNGHIKSIFKFLANVQSITHARHLGSYYRIAAAIINRYHPSLTMRGVDELFAC